jgi:hypothetical protein
MPARNRFKISVSQMKLNKIYNFYRQLLHEISKVIIILDIFPFASGYYRASQTTFLTI